MSLVPLLMTELLSEMERPSFYNIYDQHYGLPLLLHHHPYEHHPYERLLATPLASGYSRPWRNLLQENSGISSVANDKDCFKVSLDVQQFKPDELNVKVVDDYVCIEGKHEERSDQHGFISRQFTRRYKLPESVDKQKLVSSLSSDGVLQLHAPKRAIEGAKELSIPITQTNQPAIKATEKKNKNDKQEKMES